MDRTGEAQLHHELEGEVSLRWRDLELLRYVYAPGTAITESPKPYMHPVRTLDGNVVTICRPWDHRWHKGIAMTCAELSGQNFWGGPTYVRGEGYQHLDNHGSQTHARWNSLEVQAEEGLCILDHDLAWVTREGAVWFEEGRRLTVSDIDPEAGVWVMGFTTMLTNVSGGALELGSPTTNGRPLAGYGGLFWRGPRSFRDGRVYGSDGREGESMMGERSSYLGYVGTHDEVDAVSTLIFIDHPENPRHPTQWFVRTTDYPGISAAFMFDRVFAVEAGGDLSLRYRIVVASGDRGPDGVASLARRFGYE